MTMQTHPASMTADERDAARFRPDGWAAIRLSDGVSVVYYGNNKQGQPAAIAYRGKAIKREWFYRFRNDAERAQRVQAFVESVTRAADAKAARQAEKKAFKHSLAVGDVLVSSWGYDQTNIDYYQVTRASDKCVWLREISRETNATGDMQGDCVPRPGSFTGPETRHVVNQHNRVKVRSFAWASKLETRNVGGVTTYPVDHWTAYA